MPEYEALGGFLVPANLDDIFNIQREWMGGLAYCCIYQVTMQNSLACLAERHYLSTVGEQSA